MALAVRTSNFLGLVFLILLPFYSLTSSRFTIYLYFLLLGLGGTILINYILLITQSSNTLKHKTYFSLLSSILFFCILVFFWSIGDHSSIDDKGLTTIFFIIGLTLLVSITCFIIGVGLAVKRKNRSDFDYNLKRSLFFMIITILALTFIFFYNPLVHIVSKTSNSETLCSLSIGISYPHSISSGGSYIFSPFSRANCLKDIGILRNDPNFCETVCDYFDDAKQKSNCEANIKSRCNYNVALNTQSLSSCYNNDSSNELMEGCYAFILGYKDEIYTILSNPRDPEIAYAIKSLPQLGFYYDQNVLDRTLPLVNEVVRSGSLEAKKQALEILIERARLMPLEEGQKILREEILPLIANQSELTEYVNEVNVLLSAKPIKVRTS